MSVKSGLLQGVLENLPVILHHCVHANRMTIALFFGLLSYCNPAIRVIYLLVSSNPGNLSYWNPANPGYLSSGIQQLLNCMMADTRKRVSVFCSLVGVFFFIF
jgi:hypothetical protein